MIKMETWLTQDFKSSRPQAEMEEVEMVLKPQRIVLEEVKVWRIGRMLWMISWPRIMIFAAQTVKQKVISSKKLIKFLKTALISVSSLIDATSMIAEVKLSGRPLENSKLMLNTLALNSDVTSAI